MKRQKASNIYFNVTFFFLFTVQCTCSEKIYIFTFEVKIDHQLIISLGQWLWKLKWLFLPGGHLNILFVLKTKRTAVLKKRIYTWFPGWVQLKLLHKLPWNKNNITQLIPIFTQWGYCINWSSSRAELPEGVLGLNLVVQQSALGQNWYLKVSLS